MVKGDKPETQPARSTDDTGNRDVPSILLDPVAIDKDNVKAVIDSGDMKASDLCTGEFAPAVHRRRHQLISTRWWPPDHPGGHTRPRP